MPKTCEFLLAPRSRSHPDTLSPGTLPLPKHRKTLASTGGRGERAFFQVFRTPFPLADPPWFDLNFIFAQTILFWAHEWHKIDLTEMAKRRLKIKFRIPPYVAPRNDWRKFIHKVAQAKIRAMGVRYVDGDKLAISVVLYLKEKAIAVHDLDNRLKDVLDALQGRMGGPKAIRKYCALIPNDKWIFKATVTKMLPPPQSRGLGHVIITKYSLHTNRRKRH